MGLETKTLNQWMRELGYHWKPGMEQISKGLMSASEAQLKLSQYEHQGIVGRG